MLILTQTEMANCSLGLKEKIKLIKDSGFDAYDISLFKSSKEDELLLSAPDYIENAKEIRRYADEIGIACSQSHAPMPSSVGDDESDEKIFKKLVQSMEVASILGAKIIVIHPKQHLCYAENAEKLFEMNVEFYNRLIPYAKKFGIKIATENMWQKNNGAKVPCDSVCSRAWEFNKLIDTVNSEWLVGCLDIGHVSLMGADIPKFIHAMGNERLLALHIHDTDFVHDLHTAPFTNKIDYKAVAKALGEIDYKGNITFEALNFFKNLPEELYLSASRYLCDIGKYLAAEIEKH